MERGLCEDITAVCWISRMMEAKWYFTFDEMDLVMKGDPLEQTHSLHVQASSFEAPDYRQGKSTGNELSFKDRRIRGCYIRSAARSVHPPSLGIFTSLHSHHEIVSTGSTPQIFVIS